MGVGLRVTVWVAGFRALGLRFRFWLCGYSSEASDHGVLDLFLLLKAKLREPHTSQAALKWDFPKIRGKLFGGPYNKDPTIYGTILGSRIFGNSQIDLGYSTDIYVEPQSHDFWAEHANHLPCLFHFG